MADEVTEAVKASIGCFILIIGIKLVLLIGYFALNIFLWLLPAILAVIIIGAVIYAVGYVIYALLTGK